MNIAVLSGKGGTGKTTVSTNLALALSANYIDSDVEEPNGFIFLNPDIDNSKKVEVIFPEFDIEKCNLCGACVNVCQFNALAKTKRGILVFEKLCHGCEACGLVCKEDAIRFKKRTTGFVESGEGYGIKCSRGILNIGEPMAVPVIKALLKNLDNKVNIIDCPPGTSCNVVNALRYADAAILVTEPSQFGLHDLNMAVELVKKYKIPFGIIINKDDSEENIIVSYCNSNKISIIGKIPYAKKNAVAYSKAQMLYNDPENKDIFDEIAFNIREVFPWI